MSHMIAALIFIAPVAAVFGVVLTNRKAYKLAEQLLNQIFE